MAALFFLARYRSSRLARSSFPPSGPTSPVRAIFNPGSVQSKLAHTLRPHHLLPASQIAPLSITVRAPGAAQDAAQTSTGARARPHSPDGEVYRALERDAIYNGQALAHTSVPSSTAVALLAFRPLAVHACRFSGAPRPNSVCGKEYRAPRILTRHTRRVRRLHNAALHLLRVNVLGNARDR